MTTSGTDISLSSLAAAAAVAASRDEGDEMIDERVREESDGKAPVVEKRSASGSEDDEADEDEEDEDSSNNKSNKSKSSNPKQQSSSNSNKARGATYDGNLCMICSDRASGFHYGVLACEGCKGFFKRVCKEQLKQVANGGNDELTSKDGQQQQSKRHCVFGGHCEINMRTRNRCQYCRIQKCLELGMSKDGIKLGRRSKKFKQNLSHVVAAAATPTQQPLVKQETSKTVPSSNKTVTTKKSSPSPILNQEEPKQPQQQILAILPDNKFIIKAIDILSAVSAVAASASTTTTPVVTNSSSSPVATANQQQLVLANNLNILNNGHQTAGSNNLVNDSTVNASNVNSLTSAQLLAHQLVINNSNSNNTSSNNIKQQSDANNNSLKFVKIEQNGNLIDQNLNGGNVIVLSSQNSDQLKASISSNGATMCSGVAASSSSAANTANATQAPIIVLNSFNLATAPSNITNHNHNQLSPANLINSFVILNNNPNGEAIGNSSTQLQQQELQPMKQQKISIYSMLDKTQLNNIIEAIIQAHKDTDTMYNHEPTLSALISSPSAATTSSAQQQQHQSSELLRAVLERGLIALLTQTRLLDHINMLIEQAVLFAKNVPYFMNIHESDRIALLKSCVFDVICVRHATFFRTSLASRCSASLSSSSSTSSSPFSSSASSSSSDENNTSSIDLATLAACAVAASSTNHPHNGHQNQQLQLQGRLFIPLWNVWLNQETLTHSLPQLARFIAMLFDFYAYFNSIGPNDYELAIFSSYLLFNTDDQTLNDKEKLYSYHSLFHDIVLNEMLKSRSSELGREVNSSSSNSLCKPMSRDELELWMKTCCMKLKRLNQEHAKILMEQKQFIQFPDLYAELYNL